MQRQLFKFEPTLVASKAIGFEIFFIRAWVDRASRTRSNLPKIISHIQVPGFFILLNILFSDTLFQQRFTYGDIFPPPSHIWPLSFCLRIWGWCRMSQIIQIFRERCSKRHAFWRLDAWICWKNLSKRQRTTIISISLISFPIYSTVFAPFLTPSTRPTRK